MKVDSIDLSLDDSGVAAPQTTGGRGQETPVEHQDQRSDEMMHRCWPVSRRAEGKAAKDFIEDVVLLLSCVGYMLLRQ